MAIVLKQAPQNSSVGDTRRVAITNTNNNIALILSYYNANKQNARLFGVYMEIKLLLPSSVPFTYSNGYCKQDFIYDFIKPCPFRFNYWYQMEANFSTDFPF